MEYVTGANKSKWVVARKKLEDVGLEGFIAVYSNRPLGPRKNKENPKKSLNRFYPKEETAQLVVGNGKYNGKHVFIVRVGWSYTDSDVTALSASSGQYNEERHSMFQSYDAFTESIRSAQVKVSGLGLFGVPEVTFEMGGKTLSTKWNQATTFNGKVIKDSGFEYDNFKDVGEDCVVE